MPIRGAHAVTAGVTATDDDDMLAGGHDLVVHLGARHDHVLQRQKIHREVNAVELATGHRQVTRPFGAASQNHRVEICQQDCGRRIDADMLLDAKLHTLGLQLRNAAVDMRFLHLEIGDAITQQPADAITLLKHNDIVTDAAKLLCRG